MIVASQVIVLLIDEICTHTLQRNVIFITRNVIKELFLEAKNEKREEKPRSSYKIIR